MAAQALPSLQHLDPVTLARLGVLQGTGALLPERSVLPLAWPELERALPDRGLPRGVIECASPCAKHGEAQVLRGGATTIALAVIHAIHAAAREREGHCAWITPTHAPSLYAPAVVQAGVDLDRLLVVRPPLSALARTAVKVATSGAFDLVVIDAMEGLDGRLGTSSKAPRVKADGALVVRKLALACEEKGTTCLVLTNAYESRATPWPVTLRIEVERRPEAIAVRVTKDRRGRTAPLHVVRVAC